MAKEKEINEDLILKRVGERIKFLRKKGKKTQNQLGLAIDWDKANIARIERGKLNLTLKTLVKIAKALDVKPDELLKGIE